jgi:hypothetical protein
MLGEPKAHELIAAAAQFLEKSAVPALEGQPAFLARVALNALAIAAREAEFGAAAEAAERERLVKLLGQDGDRDTLNRALCAAIRERRLDHTSPGVLAHVRASVMDRVAIEQPTYGSYRAAREGRTLPW